MKETIGQRYRGAVQTLISAFLPPLFHPPSIPPADVISTVEFNQTGDLLATGDKGGRVVIFQRETQVRYGYGLLVSSGSHHGSVAV